ncbi:hypothetical protein MrNuV_ORF112 [Macrobrachium rosenbergii nudivirus]|nr:hypothetical protein MrNuV_ORF112 [Macrobrachium rosenbergii nudivirus]
MFIVCFNNLSTNYIGKILLNDKIEYINIFPHYIIYTTLTFINYNSTKFQILNKSTTSKVEDLFNEITDEDVIIYVDSNNCKIDRLIQYIENVSNYIKNNLTN